MKKATLICDMQFGSTGKGLIAGYLAKRDQPDTVITAWAANAGHTFIDSDGRKFVHTMLANGIVSGNLKRVMLGGGSLLNLANLVNELDQCSDLLQAKSDFEGVYIHESAAIITESHELIEKQSMQAIGSTSKGVGAALIDKIKRNPKLATTAGQFLGHEMFIWKDTAVRVIKHSEWVKILNHKAKVIQIEGAQGYSLGINSGFYPYSTSRECTPRQIMVDCGIPHTIKPKVVGCLRTYPIRVANRYDDQGNQIGYSGDCYPDQNELDWSELGVKPELTTVTKLPRRIFNFSKEQFNEAMVMVAPDEIFLNFANYCKDKHAFQQYLKLTQPSYVGFGATVDDVVDFRGIPKSEGIQNFIDHKIGDKNEQQ